MQQLIDQWNRCHTAGSVNQQQNTIGFATLSTFGVLGIDAFVGLSLL
jgi:hypothetical protein